ncbi:MAG: thiamine diphosphokinase [Clostridia bacterium]|nr:thiamine diphosphokinase [Clostridia bacterium]
MSKNSHVVIVANGRMDNPSQFKEIVEGADIVIGADGGLKHLEKMGVAPTVMMGDFDSIESIERYQEIFPGVPVKTFEVRKDYTDSELAVREAIKYNPKKITLLSVMGNRMDHTLANVMLLKLIYDAGIEGVVIDECNAIRYTEHELEIEAVVGTNFSIVPVSDVVTGINLYGFDYPLMDATLTLGSTTGISNVFMNTVGRVSIESGRILVVQSRD